MQKETQKRKKKFAQKLVENSKRIEQIRQISK